MSNLITTSFRDQDHAIEALNDLKRRRHNCISDLDQSVIVDLQSGDRARLLFNANQLTADGMTFVELFRSLLSAAFALPLTAFDMRPFDEGSQVVASGQSDFQHDRSLPDTRWWEEHFGESFLREVGFVVKARGAAILMLLHDRETFWIRRDLIAYGNPMLLTILDVEQNRKIGEILQKRSIGGQHSRPSISRDHSSLGLGSHSFENT
jgi:uncharacterized membrane protein